MHSTSVVSVFCKLCSTRISTGELIICLDPFASSFLLLAFGPGQRSENFSSDHFIFNAFLKQIQRIF